MATTNQHKQASVGTGGEGVTRAVSGDDGQPMAARLTTEQVWHQVAKASFAVLSQVTPAGEPRSSGVVYKLVGRRLYVAVAPDSWKARHIAASRRVAVTVPVRRGGILSWHSRHGFLGIDGLEMKAKVAEVLSRWPAGGLAVGVVLGANRFAATPILGAGPLGSVGLPRPEARVVLDRAGRGGPHRPRLARIPHGAAWRARPVGSSLVATVLVCRRRSDGTVRGFWAQLKRFQDWRKPPNGVGPDTPSGELMYGCTSR